QLKYDFEDLPSCSDYSLSSTKSSGLWEFLFVKPLAFLILELGNLIGNLGVSLILIGLAIRLILLPFTIKSSRQTFNMRKAQPEIEKIERKYRNRTDNESLMAKSQETMMVYKKYKVNPMVGCLMALIQIPLFFAFLQAIYRTPAIYEETLFGFDLGMTPMVGIGQGNYLYILLLILIAISTYFSFRQTMTQTPQSTPEAAKQMKVMLYVMLVIVVYASLTLPTALAFYWIVTYTFIAVQNIIINMINNRSLTNKPRKKKEEKKKEKIKDKLVKKEGMKYGKNN
ncbi:MAG TPA: YidC/Oxa1 family membrane protein insertase, partial [Candidatus Onthocola stercoravium]|nr:YidC/Oxa1 family membrane protein insertase [Candidatus Onthocola stercoravium]